jgi:tetratricopeptide (TPR) repeat protein
MLCLTILLTISPATIRNYIVSGRFVLISTNGPINLWIGNNPYAEGWFSYPPSEYSEKIAKEAEEKGDIAYIEEVARFIKDYPNQFARLLLKKFLLFWDSTEIANNINYELQKGFSWVSKILLLSFGLIAPLAILGILLSLKRGPLLLHLFILSFMLASILFFITARHRMPILPIFIIFSAFSLYWLYERIRAKSLKPLFLSLIPLILSFSLTHSRAIERHLAPYLHPNGFCIDMADKTVIIRDNRGTIWRGKGSFALRSHQDAIKKEIVVKDDLLDYPEASVSVRCAVVERDSGLLMVTINEKKRIPIRPEFSEGLTTGFCCRFSSTALQRGVNRIVIRPLEKVGVDILIDESFSFGRSYFLKEKDWERLKKGEFMVWLTLFPKASADRKGWATEYLRRGVGFLSLNLCDEAIENFKEAIRLDPNLKWTYCNLGITYYKKSMYGLAIDKLKKAIKIDSDYSDAHYWLGASYEEMDKLDKAIKEYKRVIELGADKERLIKTHENLVRIYYAKEMWEEILEHSKRL